MSGPAPRDLLMYARFAAGLPAYLRKRLTLDEARDTVRWRLEHRGDRFLSIMERAVYGHPGSPYLALLRMAGCEFGDLRAMVEADGLEPTLRTLRNEGVYVTFEEFKGRVPIERNGRVVPTTDHPFDNPFIVRQWEATTSGSSGTPRRIPHDLDSVLAKAPPIVVGLGAHGLLKAPMALWQNPLPGVIGLHTILRSVVIDNIPRRWFAPGAGAGSTDRPALRFRMANAFALGACRLMGHPVPWPEHVPLDRADVVARWAGTTARTEGSSLVLTTPSMALRLGNAAEEHGIRLDGVTIRGGGEPVTEAKIAPVRRAGARFMTSYGLTELGTIGTGCVASDDPSDLHLHEDVVALIQYPQSVPGSDLVVDAFCLTGLVSAASQILLNVEIDDFGAVECRACGCPLEQAGYRTHVRGVRSYAKLTGEGVTLLGGDMVRILEDVLPRRFGGTPHHYQLHEREDAAGFTRLVLVIDPAVDLAAEDEAIAAVLDALEEEGAMQSYARDFWKRAESFRVERGRTEWVGGKYPPLVVQR